MNLLVFFKLKYNVWFDEGIHYGKEWDEEIVNKIDGYKANNDNHSNQLNLKTTCIENRHMANPGGGTNILQFFLGLFFLKWFFKVLIFLILLIFAIIATPFWLLFKTKFNPWTIVLQPFLW